MKQKNTSGSFWWTFVILLYASLILLLAGDILVALLTGRLHIADLGGLLVRQPFTWAILIGFSIALWLRWKERRKSASVKRLLGKKSLAALIVFGVIAAGPFWIPIRFVVDDLLDRMLAYQFYLFFAGHIFLVPCVLIYSLGRALGEREMEKGELDEARKF